MRAKRQILSLLLALLLVWQGFSFANAETGSGTGAGVVTAGSGAGMEASTTSSSTIGTGVRTPQQVNALKDIHLYVDGTPVGEGSTLASYSKKISFEATIDKEKIKGVKENDYISVTLPAELKAPETGFEIKGKDKNGIETVMAKGTYNKDSNEIRITFTKAAEGYRGDDGKVYFNASVNTSAFTESTSKSLEIVINGGSQIYKIDKIHYDIQKDETPISFYKDTASEITTFTDADGNTHHLILYIITLDMRNVEKPAGVTSYENMRIIDTLKSNKLSYFDVKDYNLTEAQKKTYQPKYLKGIWRSGKQNGSQWENAADDKENRGPQWKLRSKDNNNNSDPVEKTFDFTYTDKNTRRSFTFPLENVEPDDGYYITYYAEINGGFKFKDGFTNQAKLVGDGIAKELKEKVYSVSEAGGSLNDSQYFNIKILKTDENGKPLQGAKFKIVNPINKYSDTITSDEYGIAELKDVSKADYVLTEVEAPKGYEKDPNKTYEIHKTDFDTASNSTITLTIPNKKKEVKKKSTSFSVEKRWVLDPKLATNKPDKVKVSVLKNGREDENLTVELSQANDWKASFSNLPKEDANGQEIVYTVSEEELAGFKAAISGTDENGFTISNYNGGRVVIPVTKIWKGSGTHPDHLNVQLWADGEKVATYTLNEANAWQHSFDMPKFNTNHKEIRYTVTEDSISGYTATTQSNPATGYVNVFVNTKNDVPPTSPNGGGNGGGGNGGGGNSPKPSPNSSTPPVPSGTTPNPGEVLNASRPSTNPESISSVLGAEREKTEPKGSVLGAGRGYVKTEDSSAMPIYLLLFALTGLGLSASILWERKRAKH